jgi:hypothetical protein
MAPSPDFDFDALEAHLIAGCRAALAAYVEEADPDDPAVFFAIDCNPHYGEYLPSIDTRANALACMKAVQADVLAHRDWLVDEEPEAWKEAHEYARYQSLRMFAHEVGDFTHHMIHDAKYEAAEQFCRSERYQQLNAGAGDDGWMEGHCRRVLARVCDALIDGGAFDGVAIARPFGVGYAYHDEPMIVCRVLY